MMYTVRLWPNEGHKHGAAIGSADTLLVYAILLSNQRIPFMVYEYGLICKPSNFGWSQSEHVLDFWITEEPKVQCQQ